jgi:hypothetical protein
MVLPNNRYKKVVYNGISPLKQVVLHGKNYLLSYYHSLFNRGAFRNN